MKILLLYHFFHPDRVISGRLFSETAQHLAGCGHEVTAYTCNRSHKGSETYAPFEEWDRVRIRRFFRPDFNQGNHILRLVNSVLLQLKWLWALRKEKFDVIIAGTDPQFCFMMFPMLKLLQKKECRIIHWAYDIYPDAIISAGGLIGKLSKISIPFTKFALSRVNEIWDIGSCMKKRLLKYNAKARYSTFTPWALVETDRLPEADAAVRQKLFGDARIGILYSGTVGHAHDISGFIELARRCRAKNLPVAFCFAGSGNTYKEQTGSITLDDTNITLAGFADESELGLRLAAADIHLISLKKDFNGVAVPSKFFGSLAMGRPLIFSGEKESCIAEWLEQFQCGWMLNEDTLSGLEKLCEDASGLKAYQERAFGAYNGHFSKAKVLSGIADYLKNNPA